MEEEDAVEVTPAVEEAEELDKVSIKEDIKGSIKKILTKPQHQEDSTMDRTVLPTQLNITRIGIIVGATATMWITTVRTAPTQGQAMSNGQREITHAMVA